MYVLVGAEFDQAGVLFSKDCCFTNNEWSGDTESRALLFSLHLAKSFNSPTAVLLLVSYGSLYPGYYLLTVV